LAEDGTEPDILCWSIKNNQSTENCVCIFIGHDNQSFFNISMSIKCKRWILFDIADNSMREIQGMDTKFIMRRSHYVEKCKDAQTLGIVVGTLTTKGYLDIIKHIQELATKRNVKTYIFSVGKVNPAKLANFSDVDCFVLVGCSENNLYNSRDFYKPLISVFEAEMALNPAWNHQVPDTYSTDFREVLPEGKLYRSSHGVQAMDTDISLVTGKVRGYRSEEGASFDGNFDGAVQERGKNQIAELSSIGKLNERTFRGLDPALGKDEPAKIEPGRKGIPIKYDEDF
jgi:diphthamide biosynthesis protein 2